MTVVPGGHLSVILVVIIGFGQGGVRKGQNMAQNGPRLYIYVKVAVNLKHLCFYGPEWASFIYICQGCRQFETSVFFSVKINISTTGGFRVGFFQPDTNHP